MRKFPRKRRTSAGAYGRVIPAKRPAGAVVVSVM
jgi:hypothetical protein